MIRRWFTWRWVESPLADESEAFLAGRYLERLHGRGEVTHVAPWMWLNCVAHSDLQRVRDLSRQPVLARQQPTDSWADARVRIARAALDACRDDPIELRRLQSAVLVPLELRLMNVPRLTPARWTEIALAELRLTGAS